MPSQKKRAYKARKSRPDCLFPFSLYSFKDTIYCRIRFEPIVVSSTECFREKGNLFPHVVYGSFDGRASPLIPFWGVGFLGTRFALGCGPTVFVFEGVFFGLTWAGSMSLRDSYVVCRVWTWDE